RRRQGGGEHGRSRDHEGTLWRPVLLGALNMSVRNASASLDDLLKQAKTTNRLLAAQLKTQVSQQDLIKLLSTTELTAREIAEILNTTQATVAVTIQRLRKKAAQAKVIVAEAEPGDESGV